MAYVGTCAAALGAALVYYPSALSHIFKGYRGTEAVGEFTNASNTLERIQFFVGLFDKYDGRFSGNLAPFDLSDCRDQPVFTEKGEKVRQRTEAGEDIDTAGRTFTVYSSRILFHGCEDGTVAWRNFKPL